MIFEAIGGMRSVAYTDAAQSAIMVFVFAAVPLVILNEYGGFIGQMASPSQNNGICSAARTFNESGKTLITNPG